MPTVTFKTLGCKLNQAETAILTRVFLQNGYEVVQADEIADVAVINTCTVTGRSDAKCRQAIRSILRQNPQTTVIVTGCYSQVAASEIEAIPGVDYVLGVPDKLSLFDHFPGPGKREFPFVQVSEQDATGQSLPNQSGDYRDQTRAFLPIQTGCDRSCSYCIVPIARGPSRSLDDADVLRHADQLIQNGYKEIVLTGVHVGDFGKDRSDKSELSGLLRQLVQLDPSVRFRLSSLDPDDLNETLIETIANHPQICRHFHVAMQSGSDSILKSMNRRHTTRELREKVESVLQSLGSVGLGTDIIVGFPGETDALFLETVAFVEFMPFSYFHVFPYSMRKGTAAAEMVDQIPSRIRIERAKQLRTVGAKMKRDFMTSFIDKEVSVLFENKKIKNRISGLSSEYLRVEVPYNPELVNRIVKVKILRSGSNALIGEPLVYK
ncbi:tRNA (N(6)-L-threonylcarbamoyladenosine(37)-C(2))-methylthiotransferase MtaB [candidate division KSB1 bacterium]|nr:tRNA (N(6)-L-threonylcarbamoyladenosine(37)-C(2))-methylthiotransferase MtaB [candidate division KSB1 bacterium]